MSVPFFFAENILSQDEIVLDEESSRHIVQVLRLKRGEQILLTDGRGNAVHGEINDANKKHCRVQKITSSFTPRPSPVLIIAISLTKNTGRFEWFLEKSDRALERRRSFRCYVTEPRNSMPGWKGSAVFAKVRCCKAIRCGCRNCMLLLPLSRW